MHLSRHERDHSVMYTGTIVLCCMPAGPDH